MIHASITNLLLFHRFLDQNENYRAITKRAPFAGPSTELSSSAKGKERAEDVAEEEEDEVGEENDAGLDFGPLTEHELMAGHVVKERLTRVLDSPSLKNHLLRSKNLLAILVSRSGRVSEWSEPHTADRNADTRRAGKT